MLTRRCRPPGFVDEEVMCVGDGTGSAFLPNQITGRPMLVVAKKVGELWAVENPDLAQPSKRLILDMGDRICSNGERGIQSIAAHPEFGVTNQWLYIFYTVKPADETECFLEDPVRGPRSTVSRMQVGSDNMVDISTEEILLQTVLLEDFNHNGGAMLFGVDGHLYITLGDGGNQANNYSQYLHTLLGKMLRLTADGGIPVDNPFQDPDISARCHTGISLNRGMACQEVHSRGLRNPFRFAMDMNSKDEVRFLVADVGGDTWKKSMRVP